ncbi:hypothetical protein [uncultured Maribacter sp.]|uniref:hypothetical protein n=1 Tax=uncultured Maribacter sp. TaxID=431308 RepID=UPI00260BD1E9|nr:hypothetical protein [uncultured Maribacter sp.]
MKKIIAIAIFILSSNYIVAQAYSNSDNIHEIKFNIGQFLITSSAEISYEYYINEDTSIGATMYFDGDSDDYNGNFGLGANVRAYFGYNPKSGVFAEAFGLYYTGEDEIEDTASVLGVRNKDYSTAALGLGGGYKWATRSDKFTVELSGGLGRNINPEDFQNTFMFRAGLSIGFRF